MIPATTQENPVPAKSVLTEKVGVPLLWLALGAMLGAYIYAKRAKV